MDILSAVHRSDLEWLETHISYHEIDWRKCVHSKSGDTALHVAALTGSTQVTSWLLSHGCDVCIEQQNMDGKRPLHMAVQASTLPIVRILLYYGATIDPLKRADWTPLMLACTKRSLQIVKYLIENGANLRLINKDGWTSFHLACREGDEEIVNYILDIDNSVWNTVSNNGRSPLHTAAMHGHETTVQTLLSRGNYLTDESDACGNTPLLESLRMGHISIARLLISKHQADIYAKDKIGRCGLHIAAEAGQAQIVKTLIETCGVDVNLLSDTALWLACGSRKRECAHRLRDLGAKDTADHKGTLPSHLMQI
ncbi:ankyrin repeat domain-containing protein 16-like isoform X3 [Cherax quadricarinatus]|uniref:ankyrin repeat domain-containing protein 16-like isoform X3 n=1 Tax=Cherax quadricarinatus TaxID=27406 RepID=UPI00387ED594